MPLYKLALVVIYILLLSSNNRLPLAVDFHRYRGVAMSSLHYRGAGSYSHTNFVNADSAQPSPRGEGGFRALILIL